MYTVLVYISTIWVVRSNARWLRESGDSLAGYMEVKDEWGDMTDTFLTASSADSKLTSIPLLEILANPTSYTTFVQHLSTEFNVESLLSLTEFVQFQQLIWEWMKRHHIEDYRDFSLSQTSSRPLFKRLSFGEGIPRSSIVFGSSTSNGGRQQEDESRDAFHAQCKEKARRLFTKYISYESKFQILIDFETSRALCQLMENEDRWMRLSVQEFTIIDMLYLFEESCDDMHMMLQDAYKRFQRTNSFEKLNEFVVKFSN